MPWYIEPSTKTIFKVVLIVLALVFLWLIRDIIMILLLAIILASAMEPLVGYLNIRKVPRVVTVLAVYIILLGLAGLVISLIVPIVASQFTVLAQNLPFYTQQLFDRFPNLHLVLGNANLGDTFNSVFNEATGGHALITRTIGIFNGLFALITVLVVSFYLVAQQQAMIDFINSVVPPKQQAFTMSLVRKIQRRMGLWVIGQLILSLTIFAMSYIGLTLLGVKYALFLALLAGLLEVVPYIGPFVSAIPAIFFALIQSPALAVAVAVLYVLVQKTEGYFLVPKIMQKTVGTSPLLVLLALLVGFKLAGIFGLLLAVPLVGAITLVVTELTANQAMQKSLDTQTESIM